MRYLAIAAAAVALAGCQKPIQLSQSASSKKIILNPQNGQVLKWMNGVQVAWQGPSPCDPSASSPDTCTVKIPDGALGGRFQYDCVQPSCPDPEVDVGSVTNLDGTIGGSAATAPDVNLWCDPAKPSEIGIVPLTISKTNGSTVTWGSTLGYPNNKLTSFTVTFDDPSACPGTINQSNPSCKVSASPGTYQYSASGKNSVCSGNALQKGTLTVTASAVTAPPVTPPVPKGKPPVK